MDASSLVSFLLVAVFWILSAALKTEKKKSTQKEILQKTERDAVERPAIPQQTPQRDVYRPAKPKNVSSSSEEGARNPMGLGSIQGESIIERKGYIVGSYGPTEGAYHWGGGTALGGSAEGISQWTHFSAQHPAPIQPPAQKPVASPRQLIPLTGDELLRGVIFSEIFSRKTFRKR